jgi:hypothetical protein
MYVCFYHTYMIKVADEIWLATSLLHLEHPSREDFSIVEIIERAMKENVAGGYRPGLQVHASVHCVATKPPNPAHHRMLSETSRGRRRLFRSGDKFHRDRRTGRIHPAPEDLPSKYRYLVEWYEHEYTGKNGKDTELSGASGSAILNFAGGISHEDAKKMREAIEEACERIEPSEWSLPARH